MVKRLEIGIYKDFQPVIPSLKELTMLYNDNDSKPTFLGVLLFWCEAIGFILIASASLKFLVVGFTVQNHYEIHDRRSYESTTTTENRCWAFCRPGSENSEDNRKLEEVKQ